MKRAKKYSVLIIDDEKSNIIELTDILEKEYNVLAIRDSGIALQVTRSSNPDIILLDVIMPNKDGYEVISELKKFDNTRDIPVIFITGLDSIDAEEKGFSLGAADYIPKPFHNAIVRKRIENQIKILERLRQQTLMTKISHYFLTDSNITSLFSDTLRMVGEFMGIAKILMYRVKDNGKVAECNNEWINPELNLKSRLNEKIVISDAIFSIINNLIANKDRDLCLHSNDRTYKEAMEPYRKNTTNYITTPIFIKNKMVAILDFSREDDGHEWSESEIDLAVLVAGVFSGVLERDAMEQQYLIAEYSRDVAEHSSRVKSEFLSRMSHELLTPLNTVLGLTQVAKKSENKDDIMQNIDKIDAASKHLVTMIHNVLNVSGGSSAFTLSKELFSFGGMLDYVKSRVNPEVQKKNQVLSIDISPEIPNYMIGDEKRITQVIIHLLVNAVKFSPEQSEISFGAYVHDVNGDDAGGDAGGGAGGGGDAGGGDVGVAGDVGDGTDENGEFLMLRFEITDTGIGISKEQQNTLFELFEQVDGGNTRKYGGIGIGLPLSKCIAELLGGEIKVESEPDKGSKFYFTCKVGVSG